LEELPSALVPSVLRILDGTEFAYHRAACLSILAHVRPPIPEEIRARITRALSHDEEVIRVSAAYAAWHLDMTPDEALPILERGLRSGAELVVTLAEDALKEAGARAAPGLVALCLSAEEVDVRSRAAGIVASMGPAAIPAIRDAFSDRRLRPTGAFINCVGELSPHSSEFTDELVALLDDPAFKESWESAAIALGSMGPGAAAAEPALLGLLRAGNAATQVSAAEALWRLDRRTTWAVPVLMSHASKGDHLARIWAVCALGRIGPPARPAVPALRRRRRDPDSDLAREAVAALERVLGFPEN
jgi:HEAT repeat protein